MERTRSRVWGHGKGEIGKKRLEWDMREKQRE